MKRSLGILLVLCLLLTGSALAAEATDAPGTPTQDVVLSLTAAWQDELKTAYDLQVMPADQLTMDTVTDIYRFVYEEHNRPVRYFPEETQEAIEAMLGDTDPDALYMTEFMRLHAAEIVPPTDLDAVMLLDVDYQLGQLVVVVLGDTTDPENLVWTPVESRVTALGQVECVVPQELMEQLQGEDVLFSLLTVRKGNRGGIVNYETDVEHDELPSKTADDMIHINTIISEDGTPLADDFALIITEESDVITIELAKIHEHVKKEELPISAYLPEESQNEIQLLLNQNGRNTQKEELVVYEYLPLITENYKDTYGDVIATFRFATPYAEGQQVVTMLGLPKDGAVETDPTLMDWAVQRAQVNADGEVEIVFDQLALIGMGEDAGLLLVLSEPLAE